MHEFGASDLAWAEDGDVGERAADHGDFVAGVETRAGLAVLVDLVGHGVAFGDAEAEVLEVVGDAGEEADGDDLVLVGFGDEGFEDGVAGAEAAAVFAHDDGADLGEVRAVEMERAAAEEVVFEDAGLGVGDGAVGDGEVADVLADLGVGAAEECAVVGEGVDEVEDVAGVLQARLVNADARSAGRERLVRARGRE